MSEKHEEKPGAWRRRVWVRRGKEWDHSMISDAPPAEVVRIMSMIDGLCAKAARIGVTVLVAPKRTKLMSVNCKFEYTKPETPSGMRLDHEGDMFAEIADLELEVINLKAKLKKWQHIRPDGMLSRPDPNPIDAIANSRGWHPLVPGESMTVHYNNRGYVITAKESKEEN